MNTNIIPLPGGGWIDLSMLQCGSGLVPAEARQRATAEMAALLRGDIVNTSEQWMTGHYWLRDSSSAPSEGIGGDIDNQFIAIQRFSRRVMARRIRGFQDTPFTDVVVNGIGGSGLGPQLLHHTFSRHKCRDKGGLNLHFVDNTDPDGISAVLAGLPRLDSTMVVTMSKSGGTREPNNGLFMLRNAFGSAGVPFNGQAVAVTCENSKLDMQAASEDWLHRFYLWDWVGGRTSITSAIGLLPAALFGLDIENFLKGAAAMDRLTAVPGEDNPAWLLATAWYHAGNGKGDKSVVFLPYFDRLGLLGKYMQQLFMESLGKSQDRQGNVVNQGLGVFGNKGTTDQHAFVQQLLDGRVDFTALFFAVLDDVLSGHPVEQDLPEGHTAADELQGNLMGTRKALHESGRESASIVLKTLSEFELGMLIALFERAVGFYGAFININAYDQPGVERGKTAAAATLEAQKRIIELLRRQGGMKIEDIAEQDGKVSVSDTAFILQHLEVSGRVRIESGSSMFDQVFALVT